LSREIPLAVHRLIDSRAAAPALCPGWRAALLGLLIATGAGATGATAREPAPPAYDLIIEHGRISSFNVLKIARRDRMHCNHSFVH